MFPVLTEAHDFGFIQMIGFVHVEATEGGGDSSHVDIQSRNDTCQAGLTKRKFPAVSRKNLAKKGEKQNGKMTNILQNKYSK